MSQTPEDLAAAAAEAAAAAASGPVTTEDDEPAAAVVGDSERVTTEDDPEGSVVGDSERVTTEDELASEIESEIAELAAQRDQYRDIAQRVQADFENYRKRVRADIDLAADRASSRLAEALLPVLDAAEAAFLAHPDAVEPLFNLMLSELRKQGLETMHLEDQPFDPNLAEAVAHETGEGGEVVVAEVLRSGYTWNGRTLRPAMVRTRD